MSKINAKRSFDNHPVKEGTRTIQDIELEMEYDAFDNSPEEEGTKTQYLWH